MLYKMYQLKFVTPVHFGAERTGTSLEKVIPICHSDTLFSAICNEFVKIYDELDLEDYKDLFEDGDIVFSSLFPFNQYGLFLPKPSLIVERKEVKQEQTSNKKKMKKIKYLLVNDFERYLGCLKIEQDFSINEEKYKFAEYTDFAKVSLRTDGDNLLYHVGSFTFYDEAGLYFVARFKDESLIKQFENILESLQYSGIGGKRSAGMGKFELEKIDLSDGIDDEKVLLNLLEKDSNYKMSLSLISPNKEEIENNNLDNSYYNLLKRNGYIYSTDYAEKETKRKSLAMFSEGSCFDFELEGTVQDVSSGGKHPVYRYGKALTIGVEV